MSHRPAETIFKEIRANVLGNGKSPGPDGIEYPAGTDTEPRATCSMCHEIKPLSDFGFHSGPDTQPRAECKQCRSERQQRRRVAIRNGTWKPIINSKRTTEKEARIAQVPDLWRQGLSYREIGERIGVTESTVQHYCTELGLSRAGPDKSVAKADITVIDNITRQLSDLVQLVHDGRHVLINLDGLDIPPETKDLWNKRLAHVGKAMRYIRSYTNKGEA